MMRDPEQIREQTAGNDFHPSSFILHPSRQRQTLDGTWDFQPDPSDQQAQPQGTWQQVPVPAPWQAASEELREYEGVAWYRRRVNVPADWRGQALVLHFGAVDYFAEVWVNGARVGEHEGGYLPFEFDIAAQAKFGADNEILLRVTDPSDDRSRFPQFPFSEIPHGKQSWYGPLSGLWQSVWLEARNSIYIEHLSLMPDLSRGEISVRVRTNQPFSGLLRAKATAPDGQVFSTSLPVEDSGARSEADGSSQSAIVATLAIHAQNPLPWHPNHPHLYQVTVELAQGEHTLDATTDTCGFRTIEAKAGQLLLNGEPIYLRSALDQDYYPDGFGTPPSLEFLEAQFRQAKELGLNSLRCHIKIADPRYYEAADRVGLLIWTELPNAQGLNAPTRQRIKQTLTGMVERDGNHPSIIIWTLFNEDWGINLITSAEHRRYLVGLFDWMKLLDPSRLVVDNSACFFNFHVKSDLNDFHIYYAIPDHADRWVQWVDAFSKRPVWAYAYEVKGLQRWWQSWHPTSPSNPLRLKYQATPLSGRYESGQEPLLVSEFGNWGLPDVQNLYQTAGGEPWWFETGGDHAQVVYPHGVQRRFKTWHLDKVFVSYSELARTSQWAQWTAMKYEIEVMRAYNSIQGYVITEFTDVNWECNGLLDLSRNPKVYHNLFAEVNADDVIVPATDRYAYWGGEECEVHARFSHYSSGTLDDVRLVAELEGSDLHWDFTPFSIRQAQVVDAGNLLFSVPEFPASRRLRLHLRIVNADGRELARNHLELTFFPSSLRKASQALPLNIVEAPLAKNPKLSAGGMGAISAPALPRKSLVPLPQALSDIGYDLVGGRNRQALRVFNGFDSKMLDYLEAGGRALVLLGNQPIQARLGRVQVVSRQGFLWSGDWAGSFAWLRQDRYFGNIPCDRWVNFAFRDIAPESVMTGFSPRDFEADVLSGLFVGWLHFPVALIGRRRRGPGQALLTTFNLAPTLGADPTGTVMFHELVRAALE